MISPKNIGTKTDPLVCSTDFGQEKSVPLNGMSEKDIEKAVSSLLK